jgi:hypothetical protein
MVSPGKTRTWYAPPVFPFTAEANFSAFNVSSSPGGLGIASRIVMARPFSEDEDDPVFVEEEEQAAKVAVIAKNDIHFRPDGKNFIIAASIAK